MPQYTDPDPARTRRVAVANEAVSKYSLDAATASKLRATAKEDPDLFSAELLSIIVARVA